MEEPQGWSCAAVWWARTPGGGRGPWTALLQPAGEVGSCSAPLSWRGKAAEESEVGGGTGTYQSLREWEVGKHPLFSPHDEVGCWFQCVMGWCPVCLRSGPPPVPHCRDVVPPPDCGLWRAGSTSDLYETLPSCSWTKPGWERVNSKGRFIDWLIDLKILTYAEI